MAASGMLLLSHVSIKMKAQQSLISRWVVSCSLCRSTLPSKEGTLERRMDGRAGRLGLAFSLAQMPALFPYFLCLAHCYQRPLFRPMASGNTSVPGPGLCSDPMSHSSSCNSSFILPELSSVQQNLTMIDMYSSASNVNLFKTFPHWCRLHVTCTILVDQKWPLRATVPPS